MHSKHAAILLFLAVNMISSGESRSVKNPSKDEFYKLLARKIQENAKRDGNVHGHIVAVNDAYFATRSVEDIPLTEDIEDANKGAGVDLFEGDIMLENSSQSETSRRNIITDREKMWPKNIHYYVSPELKDIRSNINLAIKELETRTCVRFEEVYTYYPSDHIRFIKVNGCSSSIGRQGGGQGVSLGEGCDHLGVILHEIMHALGVWHEQSRPDRDKYVEVLWNNIEPLSSRNFEKYSHGKIDNLGLKYDTSSIMHYDRYMYSLDPGRKPTIIVRGRPWERLGSQTSSSLTSNDVKEVKALFKC